jgi:hypothetical protein
MTPALGEAPRPLGTGVSVSPASNYRSIFLKDCENVLNGADCNHQYRPGHANKKHPFQDGAQYLHDCIHQVILDCLAGRRKGFASLC